MKSDWLMTSNFERAFGVISAINTLAIHAKLLLAGAHDPTLPDDVHAARSRLESFLDKLQGLVQAADDETALVVGDDPRMAELALHYRRERRQVPVRSALYTVSLPELRRLIQSDQPADIPQLIECLDSLRTIVEQNVHSDFAGILGEE